MNKWLLMIIFLLAGSAASAQLCKYIVDDTDPLTDEVIRTIKTRITGPLAGVDPYYYIFFKRYGSKHKIRIEIADYGELTHSIPKESELILRAGDGSIIRIYALEEAQPEKIVDISTVLTAYNVEYEIPEADMQKIANSGLVFIRGEDFKNSFSDQRIPSAVTRISKENAECIFR